MSNLRDFLLARTIEFNLTATTINGKSVWLAPNGNDIALASAVMAHPDWPTLYRDTLQTKRALLAGMGGVQAGVFLAKIKGFATTTDIPTIAAWQAGINAGIEAGQLPAGLTVQGLQLAVGETISLLEPTNGGIDFNSEATRAIMNILIFLTVITETEANAGLATQAYKQTVTHPEIAEALGRNF